MHRKFWQHPKAERVGLEAVGLWTLCSSWSRDQRSAGLISFDCELLEGRESLVEALVRERLWHKTALGYQYNDWDTWNADEAPRTTAAKLLAEIVPPGHPGGVLVKLQREVADLLGEGIEYGIVKAALRLWLGKANAAPSWLPMLVSDVVRKGGSGERDSALREAWLSGDTRPLVKFGLVFTQPDVPMDIKTPDDARAWMLRQKKTWIERVRKEQ